MDVWLARESNKCMNPDCTNQISEPHTYNFHHLLEKSKYPLLRYDPANIVILCWRCHDQMHLMRGKITSFDMQIEELKQKMLN
jgi:5-methylcytosine-specific restriction endonuclease McrA